MAYGRLCTEFYDLDKPAPPADELAFYDEELAGARGPVLEAMCGSGRFLVALLERGLEVDGVDASPSMLAACRARAARLGHRPALFEQRVEELTLAREYAAVFLTGGSFAPVAPEAAAACLGRIRAHLQPGGRFIAEVWTPAARDPPSHTWQSRFVTRSDGSHIVCQWLSRHNHARSCDEVLFKYESFEENRVAAVEIELMTVHYYGTPALRALMDGAGLAIEAIYADHSRTPPDSASPQLIVVCRRGA